MIVVVMGVAGSGKTTVGRLLAERLGFGFAEGDEFHAAASIDKMSRGVPLGDADRWPWLDRMEAAIDRWTAEGRDMVLACSALKRSYRDRLIGARANVRLVYLRGDEALIRGRLEARQGHYMPAALLDSQFAALEPPDAAEDPIAVPATEPPESLVLTIGSGLGHLEESAAQEGKTP